MRFGEVSNLLQREVRYQRGGSVPKKNCSLPPSSDGGNKAFTKLGVSQSVTFLQNVKEYFLRRKKMSEASSSV